MSCDDYRAADVDWVTSLTCQIQIFAVKRGSLSALRQIYLQVSCTTVLLVTGCARGDGVRIAVLCCGCVFYDSAGCSSLLIVSCRKNYMVGRLSFCSVMRLQPILVNCIWIQAWNLVRVFAFAKMKHCYGDFWSTWGKMLSFASQSGIFCRLWKKHEPEAQNDAFIEGFWSFV